MGSQALCWCDFCHILQTAASKKNLSEKSMATPRAAKLQEARTKRLMELSQRQMKNSSRKLGSGRSLQVWQF